MTDWFLKTKISRFFISERITRTDKNISIYKHKINENYMKKNIYFLFLSANLPILTPITSNKMIHNPSKQRLWIAIPSLRSVGNPAALVRGKSPNTPFGELVSKQVRKNFSTHSFALFVEQNDSPCTMKGTYKSRSRKSGKQSILFMQARNHPGSPAKK